MLGLLVASQCRANGLQALTAANVTHGCKGFWIPFARNDGPEIFRPVTPLICPCTSWRRPAGVTRNISLDNIEKLALALEVPVYRLLKPAVSR